MAPLPGPAWPAHSHRRPGHTAHCGARDCSPSRAHTHRELQRWGRGPSRSAGREDCSSEAPGSSAFPSGPSRPGGTQQKHLHLFHTQTSQGREEALPTGGEWAWPAPPAHSGPPTLALADRTRPTAGRAPSAAGSSS